jgi:hypothetical protein
MNDTINDKQSTEDGGAVGKPAVMGWRELATELPPEHEKVLVFMAGGNCLMGVIDSHGEWSIYWADGRNSPDDDRPVTHWMPIPACP